MSVQSKVREFHETFGAPVGTVPALIHKERADLRVALIDEELDELRDAILDADLVGVADALGDLAYVVYGAAVEYGIDLDKVITEIHASNMSKLDENGEPIYREDGKIMKSDSYWPPRLDIVLEEQGYRGN